MINYPLLRIKKVFFNWFEVIDDTHLFNHSLNQPNHIGASTDYDANIIRYDNTTTTTSEMSNTTTATTTTTPNMFNHKLGHLDQLENLMLIESIKRN